MSIPNIPLRSARDPSPPDSLRVLWPTIAEPITFAPPITVDEDDDAFWIHFHVAGRTEEDLEVVIEGQTLVILGEALPRSRLRAKRTFALPSSVDSSRARLRLDPPVLEVHIIKSASARRRAIVVRGG